ncbi:MAG TPA: VOC family protein [Candidatus Dormibacteraeota bacterium]
MGISIKPCLVFSDRCEEAINLYVSMFKNSKVLSMVKSEGGGPIAKGQVMSASFLLDGREIVAFDGGPTFTFGEGFSLMVTCQTQDEIDHLWTGLLAGGGEESRCGWLKDPFGVSWQIIPSSLVQMLGDAEHGNSAAAMDAMLKMQKLDIATLEKAYNRG